MKYFLLIVSIVVALTWSGVRIYKSVDFNIQCTSHLKRAADANTVEIASKELRTTLDYLENHNLTTGTVSIFLRQPKNDIGFWYNNIKASYDELGKVSEDASLLEKSNLLMKLRETLVDQGESTNVTCPNGISIYPNNVMYFWLGLLSWLGIFIFGCWIGLEN